MWGLGTDNLHSALVAWLKILLPLAALAVLSTLFMVSRSVDPADAIPYAQVDIEDRLRDPRLTDAIFAGMTQDGTAVTLKAAQAVPGVAGTSNAGGATGLSGKIEMPDGATVDLAAAKAQLDHQVQTVTLSGGVSVSSSNGVSVQTDSLTLALDRTRLESGGAVTAKAPFGRISADRLVLTRQSDLTYQMVFTGHVQMLYLPGSSG
jgi:lipopolysaccharide export system protein LptC